MGVGAGSWRVIVATAIALPVGCVFASGGLGPADTTGSSSGGAGTSSSSGITSSSTTSASSAAGGGMGGAGTSSSSSSTTTSSSTTSSSSSSTTTSSSSSSSTTSSSSSTTSSSSSTSSGGCTPTPATVCCGDMVCPWATSQCCVDQASMPVITNCISTGIQCTAGTISVRCDSAADCPGIGNVCCGYWDGAKYAGTVMCQGENNCKPPVPEGLAGFYPLCDYPGGSCPPGMMCKPEPYLGPGHGYCYY